MIPFLLEAGLKGFFCDEWMIFRGVTRSKPRWVVPKIGGNTQNGWFIMENPIKHGMIWGITYPYFWKHPGIPSSFRDGATAVWFADPLVRQGLIWMLRTSVVRHLCALVLPRFDSNTFLYFFEEIRVQQQKGVGTLEQTLGTYFESGIFGLWNHSFVGWGLLKKLIFSEENRILTAFCCHTTSCWKSKLSNPVEGSRYCQSASRVSGLAKESPSGCWTNATKNARAT